MTAAEKINEMGIVPVVVLEDAMDENRWRKLFARAGFRARR